MKRQRAIGWDRFNQAGLGMGCQVSVERMDTRIDGRGDSVA
jgi:hypothetical protein